MHQRQISKTFIILNKLNDNNSNKHFALNGANTDADKKSGKNMCMILKIFGVDLVEWNVIDRIIMVSFHKTNRKKKTKTIRFIRRHFVSRMIFYFKSNIELWLMTMLAKVENPCKNHLRCIHFERILCTIMSTSIEIHAFETISYFP